VGKGEKGRGKGEKDPLLPKKKFPTAFSHRGSRKEEGVPRGKVLNSKRLEGEETRLIRSYSLDAGLEGGGEKSQFAFSPQGRQKKYTANQSG